MIMRKRIEELDKEFQELMEEFEQGLKSNLELIGGCLAELMSKRSIAELENLQHLAHKCRGSSGLLHLAEFNVALAVLEEQAGFLLKEKAKLTKEQIGTLQVAFLTSLEFLPERLTGKVSQNQLTALTEADPQVKLDALAVLPKLDRILVIEDDELCIRFVTNVLSSMDDLQVDSADTLAGALQMLEEDEFDLILLDLHLSDSTGLDTYRRVRQISGDVPLLILTSDTNRQSALEAVASGAQDWLGKNVLNADNLIRCVRYAIARNSAEQTAARMRAIDDFMSVISHDVKMPLEAMARLHMYLLEDAFLPLEIRSYVKVLQETNISVVDRLARILALYSVETGGTPRRKMPTDFGKLIEQCLNQITKEHEGKKLELTSELPAMPIIGQTDPELLQRAFMMILDNAAKHSFAGSGISIKLSRQRETVAISVRNQGPSIPQSELRKMFKSFRKGQPGKNYVAETGMSMYFCYQLIKSLGGTIVGESKDNVTTFAISLPWSAAADEDAETCESEDDAPSDSGIRTVS